MLSVSEYEEVQSRLSAPAGACPTLSRCVHSEPLLTQASGNGLTSPCRFIKMFTYRRHCGETERSEVIRSRPRKFPTCSFRLPPYSEFAPVASWYDSEEATFCYWDEKLARVDTFGRSLRVEIVACIRQGLKKSSHNRVADFIDAREPTADLVRNLLGGLSGT